MTMLLRAARAVLVPALLFVATGVVAPSHAAAADTGTLDLTRAEGAHGTCAKAGTDLIAASRRNYYMRRSAFVRIQRSRLLASNVSQTSKMPNGTTIVTTDVVRCVARAQRLGARGSMTVYYALTYGPDVMDWVMSGRSDTTPPPPPSYTVTYTTGGPPSW